MATVKYNVRGATCAGCANAIERAVASLSGVLHIEFNLDAKQITVDYDGLKVDAEAIGRRIEDAGYEAELA